MPLDSVVIQSECERYAPPSEPLLQVESMGPGSVNLQIGEYAYLPHEIDDEGKRQPVAGMTVRGSITVRWDELVAAYELTQKFPYGKPRTETEVPSCTD